jgi:Cdc6-like AAA superfamily ATPase
MQHLILVIVTSSLLVKCNADEIYSSINIPSSEIKMSPNSDYEIEKIVQQDMNSVKNRDKVENLVDVDINGNNNKVSYLRDICGFGKFDLKN